MYGIALIAVLALAGGAIAFIGDRLGSKIGKKKMILFGLRPKYTSTLVTVITGILITLLTIAASAAVSENVRTALFGMEKLNRRMAEVQNALTKTTSELEAAQYAAEEAKTALAKSQAAVKDLKIQQSELEQKTARLENGNRDLEKEKKNLTDDILSLSEENRAVAAANERLAIERDDLEKRTKDLRDGLVAMREGDIVWRAREVIAAGTVKENLDADSVRRSLGEIIAQADAASISRTGLNDDAGRVWLNTRDYDRLAAALTDNPKPYAIRLVAIGNLVRGEPVRADIEVYEEKCIYKKDEFVLGRRYEIKNSPNREAAEGLLREFLHAVNEAAVKKGIIPDPMRGSVGVIEVAQIYEIIDALEKLKGNIAIVAYADDNTYTLGPLRLRFGFAKLGSNLGISN